MSSPVNKGLSLPNYMELAKSPKFKQQIRDQWNEITKIFGEHRLLSLVKSPDEFCGTLMILTEEELQELCDTLNTLGAKKAHALLKRSLSEN